MAQWRRGGRGRRASTPVYRIARRADGPRHQLCVDASAARFPDVKPMRTLALIWMLVFLGVHGALAHETPGDEPYLAWTFDPWIIAPLAIISTLYFVGALRLWWRAGYHVERIWHGIAY